MDAETHDRPIRNGVALDRRASQGASSPGPSEASCFDRILNLRRFADRTAGLTPTLFAAHLRYTRGKHASAEAIRTAERDPFQIGNYHPRRGGAQPTSRRNRK